jgi:photosystem II stability/assembly factor-like uncharacterized protein
MFRFLVFIAFFIFMSFTFVFGQTWTQIPSGTNKNLTAISFPSDTVGYIGGEDSLLLKTTDGGQTWSQLNYSGITFFPGGDDIIDLKFVSETIGFLTVGPYSGTYKTIDGGNTWTTFEGLYACYNSGLYFFDENNGFLGGSGCFSGEIINKLDNGIWTETNVTPQFILQDGMINNFDFSTANMGLATGTGDYFFRTLNGGTSWDTIPNTLNDTDSLTSVLFINNSTVLATFTSISPGTFGVLVSFDTGLTWQPEMNSATFFYPSMFATEKAGNNHIFIGGEQSLTSGGINPGLIYESNGSITNWTYESVAESIRDMDSYDDSVVFGVGNNGYIVVNQNFSQLGITTREMKLDFNLYPNPNQGAFTLELEKSTIDDIEIIDQLGRQVYYSASIPKGKKIKITNLSAGIYQVKIQSSGLFTIKQVVIL